MEQYEINTNRFGKVYVGGLPTKYGWGHLRLTDWATDKQVDSWEYKSEEDVVVREEQLLLHREIFDDLRYNIKDYPTPSVKELHMRYTRDLVQAKVRLSWVSPEYPHYVTLAHNVRLNQQIVDFYKGERERRKGIVKAKKELRKLFKTHETLSIYFLNDEMDDDTWRISSCSTTLVPLWGDAATSGIYIHDTRFMCPKDYNWEKAYSEMHNQPFDGIPEEKDPYYGIESCDTWDEAVGRAKKYVRFFEEEVV